MPTVVSSAQITLVDSTDSVQIALSPASIVLQATSAGVVNSYATATSDVAVILGGQDVTSLWTLTLSSTSGCTATLSSGTVTVSAMSANNATVTITATRLGWSTLTGKLTLAKARAGADGVNGQNGSTGQRGTVQLARAITGSTWSNSEANLALSGAGYGSAILGDVVTLYNAAAKYSEGRTWSGSAWLALTSWISGNMLINGTLVAEKIATQTIRTEHLEVGAATNTYAYDFSSQTGIMAANGANPYVDIDLLTVSLAGVSTTIDVNVQIRLGEHATTTYSFAAGTSVRSELSLKFDSANVDNSVDHRIVCSYSGYNAVNNRHTLSARLSNVVAGTHTISIRLYAYAFNSSGTQLSGHRPAYYVSAKLFLTENKV